MAKALLKVVINALLILVLANIIPGIIVANFYTALVVVVILSLANLILRPILLLLTLPINLMTLGCFTFFINGLILWFVATIVKGFEVDSLFTAIIASIILSLLQMGVDQVLEGKKS